MRLRGAVEDFGWPEKGDQLFWETYLGRRFWDGFKRQVGAFKAQVGGPIQTEFKKDFTFRTKDQGLVRQNPKIFVLKPQGKIVGQLAFGLLKILSR